MLKIYHKNITRQIRSNEIEYYVSHTSYYVIEDVRDAKTTVKEYDLYNESILNVTYLCSMAKRRRGYLVYVDGDDCFYKFKQWKNPDAKLIEYISYTECTCSVRDFSKLPVDKVIAYLKQEGLSFNLTK